MGTDGRKYGGRMDDMCVRPRGSIQSRVLIDLFPVFCHVRVKKMLQWAFKEANCGWKKVKTK